MQPTPTPEQVAAARQAEILRALKKQRDKLARKLEAVRGDLAEAERAPLHRRHAEALLTYLKQVPARASSVTLPDPAEQSSTLEVALDPNLSAQGNVARLFKRAAKGERALAEIPPRIAALEAELHALRLLLERIETARSEAAARVAIGEAVVIEGAVAQAMDLALAALPPAMRAGIARAPAGPAPARVSLESVSRGAARAPNARLQPRRYRTREGWDVLIGRNNDGNDYLSHTLARPEDYWFHVHGCPGSHVVLRRGKGKNEPSKATIAEVASWAAFFSQARTAGKVPVIWTLKKYVRKPRKSPAGLAQCERENQVMVRPVEPAAGSESDSAETA